MTFGDQIHDRLVEIDRLAAGQHVRQDHIRRHVEVRGKRGGDITRGDLPDVPGPGQPTVLQAPVSHRPVRRYRQRRLHPAFVGQGVAEVPEYRPNGHGVVRPFWLACRKKTI